MTTDSTKPPAPWRAEDMIAAPIKSAVNISGLSRSTLYRAAAAKRIRLLKVGRSSLVDMASLRAYLASLPEAHIRPEMRR